MFQYNIELLAQFFAICISIYALKKRSVSRSGFTAMLLIATFFIWNNGIAMLTILFSMFLSSSLLTKYKNQVKSTITQGVIKKHGPRDAIQAVANLGVAGLCFVIYTFTNDASFILGAICSVATSNADSWASEIGVLSKKAPVMITTFKPCKAGISGGVTKLGTLGGIGGSVFIALVTSLLYNHLPLQISRQNIFFIVSISGIAGLLLDSVLGATIQVIYQNQDGDETESATSSTKVIRGIKGINNDMVNFLSSGLIAMGIIILC